MLAALESGELVVVVLGALESGESVVVVLVALGSIESAVESKTDIDVPVCWIESEELLKELSGAVVNV